MNFSQTLKLASIALISSVSIANAATTYDSMYLRGTHNGWSTSTPMTKVNDDFWQIDVTFSGDNQSFKFDALGNWQTNFGDNNNDGIAEQSGGNINVIAGDYTVTFNDNDNTYSIEEAGTDEFESNYSSMFIHGIYHEADLWEMELVGDNEWEAVITFHHGTSDAFYFDVDGNRTTVFGDIDPVASPPFQGFAEQNGNVIPTTFSETFRITFNDDTTAYSIEQVTSLRKTLDNVSVVGNYNNWDATESPMVLVSHNLWQLHLTLPESEIRFSTLDGSFSYGDDQADGIADRDSQQNILPPQGAAHYLVRFNDETNEYFLDAHKEKEEPTARIQASAVEVNVGDAVIFDGRLSFDNNDVVSYEWSDGETSSITSIKFQIPGVQTVSLTVADAQGNTHTSSMNITVNHDGSNLAPVADAGEDRVLLLGETAILDGSASFDPEGSELVYQWIEGTDTGPTYTSTPTRDGKKAYTLTVIDSEGLSSQDTVVVEFVENFPPVVSAGGDQHLSVQEAVLVQLNGAASDPDGSISSIEWMQQSGPQVTLNNANTLTPTFSHTGEVDAMGEMYHFVLRVQDDFVTDGEPDPAESLDMVMIHVMQMSNMRPTAAAGKDLIVAQGGNVAFDGTKSVDRDGSIESYVWTSEAFDAPLTGYLPVAQFNEPGEFVVTLTVTDNEGATGTDSMVVTVVGEELAANYETMHMAGSHNGWSPTATPMTLIADNVWSLSLDVDAGFQFKFVPVNWSLSFGDNDGNGIADNDGGGNIVRSEAGTYLVTFNDETLAYSVELDSGPQAPTVDAGANQSVRFDVPTITLSGSANDADGSIETVFWSQVTGSTIQIQNENTLNASFANPGVGTYTFNLTATDNDVLSSSDEVTVVVVPNSPPTVNAGADATTTAGSQLQLSASASDADGTIQSYAWTSNAWSGALAGATINPIFNNIGTFDVTVTVTDNDGASAQDFLVVTVQEDSFTANHESMHLVGNHNGWSTTETPFTLISDNTWEVEIELTAGNQFKFVPVNWSLSYGDNNGDGIADNAGGGNIAVDESGQYTITFNDESLVYTVELYVGPQAPMVDAGADQQVRFDQATISLTASASDSDGSIVSVEWQQTAGESVSLNNADQLNASFATPGIGSYEFEFSATDNDGQTSTDSVAIEIVANSAPTANAGSDISVMATVDFTLNANQSSDSDGSIDSYVWTSNAWSGQLTGEQVTTSVSNEGEYTVTLTVTDNDGESASDTLVLEVREFVDQNTLYPTMRLRGDHEGWNNGTPMNVFESVLWVAEVTFPVLNTNEAGFDNENTPGFKFDVSGNQATQFGNTNGDRFADSTATEIKVSSGTYRIIFNDRSKAFSATPLNTNSRFNSMYISGDLNGQDLVAMELVDVNTWKGLATFRSGGSFVLDVMGDDAVTYGGNLDISDGLFNGNITKSGQQINVDVAGKYEITFNDESLTLEAVLIEKDVPELNFASMHIRGDFNGWGAQPMIRTGGQWVAIAEFTGNQDDFKFDAWGDWSGNATFGDVNADGIADNSGGGNIKVPGPGIYRIVFNDDSLVYSISNAGGFNSSASAVEAFGTFNVASNNGSRDFVDSPMYLVADNTWQRTVRFKFGVIDHLRFIVSRNGSNQLYGDASPRNESEIYGTAEINGPRISVNVFGIYTVTFNDVTNAYSIERMGTYYDAPNGRAEIKSIAGVSGDEYHWPDHRNASNGKEYLSNSDVYQRMKGYAGDIALWEPSSGVTDNEGYLYFGDNNHVVWRTDLFTNYTEIFSGHPYETGHVDSEGTIAAARFNNAFKFTIDEAREHIYILDIGTCVVREIDLANSSVSLVAGEPQDKRLRDGTGNARFCPYGGDGYAVTTGAGIQIDEEMEPGNPLLWVTDGPTIRKVEINSGRVTTVAGQGNQTGRTNAVGRDIRFRKPYGISVKWNSNRTQRLAYITEASNAVIRELNLDTLRSENAAGTRVDYYREDNTYMTTDIGEHRCRENYQPWDAHDWVCDRSYRNDFRYDARLRFPFVSVMDGENNLVFMDSHNNVVRKLDTTTYYLSTIAGEQYAIFNDNTQARVSSNKNRAGSFRHPGGVAVIGPKVMVVFDSRSQEVKYTKVR